MKQRLKMPKLHLWGFFPIALLLLLAMSACASIPFANVLGPLPLLGNAALAMQQVKSAHMVVSISNTTHLTQSLGILPQDIAVNVTGSGVEALPEQEQMNLTVTAGNLPTLQATETYSKGKWFVQFPNQSAFALVPGSVVKSTQGGNVSPVPGITIQNLNINAILALVQHLQITDHGDENVAGMQLHHLTVAFDTQAVKQLLTVVGMQQNVQGRQVLNAIQSANGTADFFINDTNSLVYRLGLTGTVNTQIPSVNQQPISATTHFMVQIDLSQINQPVTIVVPANAVMLPIPFINGQ